MMALAEGEILARIHLHWDFLVQDRGKMGRVVRADRIDHVNLEMKCFYYYKPSLPFLA